MIFLTKPNAAKPRGAPRLPSDTCKNIHDWENENIKRARQVFSIKRRKDRPCCPRSVQQSDKRGAGSIDRSSDDTHPWRSHRKVEGARESSGATSYKERRVSNHRPKSSARAQESEARHSHDANHKKYPTSAAIAVVASTAVGNTPLLVCHAVATAPTLSAGERFLNSSKPVSPAHPSAGITPRCGGFSFFYEGCRCAQPLAKGADISAIMDAAAQLSLTTISICGVRRLFLDAAWHTLEKLHIPQTQNQDVVYQLQQTPSASGRIRSSICKTLPRTGSEPESCSRRVYRCTNRESDP